MTQYIEDRNKLSPVTVPRWPDGNGQVFAQARKELRRIVREAESRTGKHPGQSSLTSPPNPALRAAAGRLHQIERAIVRRHDRFLAFLQYAASAESEPEIIDLQKGGPLLTGAPAHDGDDSWPAVLARMVDEESLAVARQLIADADSVLADLTTRIEKSAEQIGALISRA